MRPYLFIFSILFLLSCGSSKEEKVESGIDLAQTYLSSEKCDDALKALEEESDFKNPIYLQVLASAHACKAGVRVVEVIDELENLNTNELFYEIATRDFAQVKKSSDYYSLTSAINTIIDSTSEVSQDQRDQAFGKRKGQDLGVQLLMYSVVQVSRFLNYYGQAKNGKKGEALGENAVACFLDYVNNPQLPANIPDPNACSTTDNGHPELDLTTASGRVNACHGIILINNVLDVFEKVDFGDSNNLKVIKKVAEKIAQIRDQIAGNYPELVSIFYVRNQKSCEDLSDSDIESYIFAVYEVGFK